MTDKEYLEILTEASSWCSIAGLGLSILALWVTFATLRTARRIQRDIFERERLPELRKTLQAHLTNLNGLLIGSAINKIELKAELHRLRATKNSIRSKRKFGANLTLTIFLFLSITLPHKFARYLAEKCYTYAIELLAEMTEADKDLAKTYN